MPVDVSLVDTIHHLLLVPFDTQHVERRLVQLVGCINDVLQYLHVIGLFHDEFYESGPCHAGNMQHVPLLVVQGEQHVNLELQGQEFHIIFDGFPRPDGSLDAGIELYLLKYLVVLQRLDEVHVSHAPTLQRQLPARISFRCVVVIILDLLGEGVIVQLDCLLLVVVLDCVCELQRLFNQKIIKDLLFEILSDIDARLGIDAGCQWLAPLGL